MSGSADSGLQSALDFLTPGAGLRGPLFASLLRRLTQGPRELLPGQRIGPYRVKAALGRGGSAIVYLAERADGEFEQEVALKLVTPEHEAEAARVLLRRERQILASLRHPGIARLLDGGTTEDGLLWFAMEPIFGERVDRWCDGRPLAERLRLFLDVCRAVEFAHARLLVHRDLKPGNILVTPAGEARVLDFGIAAMLERADAAASTPAAMTPGFASPEQLRGAAPATTSDIWQLGRLLEVMLGDAHALPRPSIDLRAIISKARHDEPERRYGTVRELIDDVERLLQRRPVLARGGGYVYRTLRFLARHRWSTGAAAATLVLLSIMGATFTLRLAAERDAAKHEAERAEAATHFLVRLFQVSDPAINRGESLSVRELLGRGTASLRDELADQPALRAQLLRTIGQIHLALGEASRADPLLGEAAAILRVTPATDPLALATALHARATAALQLGQPRDALALLAETEPLLHGDQPATTRLRLSVLGLRAMSLIGTGRASEALAPQRSAYALAMASSGPDSLETASAVHDLGIVHRAMGQPHEALAYFERGLSIYRSQLGPDHPSTVSAQKNVATSLIELDEIDRGRPLLEDAVARLRRLYGGKGATYGAALRALADMHLTLGETARARDGLLESERLIREALGPDAASLAYTLHALAAAHARLGDHELALAAARDALRIRSAIRPPDHPELIATRMLVIAQLRALGRDDEAGRALHELPMPAATTSTDPTRRH